MSLFDRIKETVEKFKTQMPTHVRPAQPSTPPPEQPLDATYKYTEKQYGYVDHAQMVNAAIQAGRSQRLLYIRYKGMWRHIEPYELKKGKNGLLLYAWCLVDNDTHSFYLHKIQEMHVTDIPFTARFPIKI